MRKLTELGEDFSATSSIFNISLQRFMIRDHVSSLNAVLAVRSTAYFSGHKFHSQQSLTCLNSKTLDTHTRSLAHSRTQSRKQDLSAWTWERIGSHHLRTVSSREVAVAVGSLKVDGPGAGGTWVGDQPTKTWGWRGWESRSSFMTRDSYLCKHENAKKWRWKGLLSRWDNSKCAEFSWKTLNIKPIAWFTLLV